MKFKITCDESNHICDKSQYKEASLWEKIKLNIHLLYCDFCRKYTANNQRLTKNVQKARLKTLSPSSKKIMKEKLRQEIEK
ncbi:MAG: hypothetical protein R2793_10315 [Flavobacteriaceae bacterium]